MIILLPSRFSSLLPLKTSSLFSFSYRYYCTDVSGLWKSGDVKGLEEYYSDKASQGDPNAQFLLGMLLCQQPNVTSNVVSDLSPIAHYLEGGRYVLELPSVTSTVPQPADRVNFLRWVRQERDRLQSLQQDPPEKEDEQEKREMSGYFWFLQSSLQNLSISMYFLGSLLLDQVISTTDYQNLLSKSTYEYQLIGRGSNEFLGVQEGYKWLWRSALGNKNAYNLLPPAIPDESIWIKNLDKQCGFAWYDIGRVHYYGHQLLEISPSIDFATKCFDFAARQHNDADALFILGYQSWPSDWSSVTDRENHQAIQLMQKAANLGHSEAMYFLSVAHYQGVLPDENFKLSIHWMSAAAKRNNQRALHIMGDWLTQGIDIAPHISIDYRKAFQYYGLATQHESLFYTESERKHLKAISYCCLGVLYLRGLGTELNPQKAFICYQKASLLGNAQACFNLADMLRNGIGVGVNQKSADRYQKLGEKLLQESNHPQN